MAAQILLVLIFAAGLAASVYTAAMTASPAHMLVNAVVGLLIFAFAYRERAALIASGAVKSAVASSTARHMGYVWLWGALGFLAIYTTVMSWHEWWHFCLGFAAIGALCLYFSITLRRDADAGREDASLLQIARYLTIAQLVGMIATIVGLILDNKMPRTVAEPDWAANNICFFGAVALALISINALRSGAKTEAHA
jgi:hypothetical protein